MANIYVFVDFDGVMTSTLEQPGSYLVENGEYGISSTPCRLFTDFVRETGAKVVISSNWRRRDDDGMWLYKNRVFYNPLPKLKMIIGDAYYGVLPVEKHLNKQKALEKWFRIENLNPAETRYVIFDDDVREGFHSGIFKEHFILTDYKTGLCIQDIEKAKGILNNG